MSSGHSWLEASGESATSPLGLAFCVGCTWAVERDNSLFSHSSEGSGPSCGGEGKEWGGEVSKCAAEYVMFCEWAVTGMLRVNSALSQLPSVAAGDRAETWALSEPSVTVVLSSGADLAMGGCSLWDLNLKYIMVFPSPAMSYTFIWCIFRAFKERETFVFSSFRLLMKIHMVFHFSFPCLLWLGKSIFSTSIFYKVILWGAIQKENVKIALLVSTQVSQESSHWLMRFKVHFENFGDFFLLSQHFSFTALTCLKFLVTKAMWILL